MAANARTLLNVLWLSLLSSTLAAEWHSAEHPIMGTKVSVELWHADQEHAQAMISAVMADMRQVEAEMSPYVPSSYVTALNEKAARSAVAVPENLFNLVQKSQYYSQLSDGAFDISFSSVGQFYDYRQHQKPTADQVEKGLTAINYRLIELNKKHQTIRFRDPHLKIDLGGIAKGYAVDRAIAILQKGEIESALVSAGGDSRILGDRKGTPWVIGIRHPRKAEDYAVKIPLSNTAISTSGDYERFFFDKDQGKRVHHILNPSTGKSANKVQSVSVLAPFAVDSDALSTTVFVLGITKGLALINQISGIDAIIIDSDGKLHYSDGLLYSK